MPGVRYRFIAAICTRVVKGISIPKEEAVEKNMREPLPSCYFTSHLSQCGAGAPVGYTK